MIPQPVRDIARGRFEVLPPRRTFALGVIHSRLCEYLDFDDGFFFEAGAYDGLSHSNTAYFERYRGWRGILVEPVQALYESCLQHRPEATVIRAALVPADYTRPEVEIRFAGLMSIGATSEIDAEQHLASAAPFYRGEEEWGVPQRAPARTAQSIIDEAGNPPIDLFVLDVEGAERSALAGLDLNRTRPRFMLIEAREPSSMITYMATRGYMLHDRVTKLDLLFRRR